MSRLNRSMGVTKAEQDPDEQVLPKQMKNDVNLLVEFVFCFF